MSGSMGLPPGAFPPGPMQAPMQGPMQGPMPPQGGGMAPPMDGRQRLLRAMLERGMAQPVNGLSGAGAAMGTAGNALQAALMSKLFGGGVL